MRISLRSLKSDTASPLIRFFQDLYQVRVFVQLKRSIPMNVGESVSRNQFYLFIFLSFYLVITVYLRVAADG